jgi:beta-N-acetylhexosaminidase
MNVAGMPLAERAAQVLFPRIGSNMPPPRSAESYEEAIVRLMDACPIGGLILFNGSLPETPGVLARLQARSPIPLLVASDLERGFGQQVTGGTVFPHAMAWAHLGEDAERLLEAAAAACAREALSAGIHVTFAPVADVNLDPRNPIIGTRAFGTDPEGVARLVRAFVRGCHSEGLLATAKHFPGHGNTSEDSHATLPVVRASRDELERADLVPFRAAIDEGVDLVMTAHVAYPGLDDSGAPATLSRPILTELLRHDLGFQGAVVTDSLLMGGIRAASDDVARLAPDLIRAGVDILLDVPDPVAARDALVQAVETGALDASLLDRAVGRVLALKRRMTARFGDSMLPDGESSVRSDFAMHRELALEVARRALVTFPGASIALPLGSDAGEAAGLGAVLIRPFRGRGDDAESALARALGATYPSAFIADVGPETSQEELAGIRDTLLGCRHVLVALVVKPAAWRDAGLLEAQSRFVRDLSSARPVVLASLGSPYILDEFESAVQICTFSDVDASQVALAEHISGTRGSGHPP